MADATIDPTEEPVSLVELTPIRVCGVARRAKTKKRCSLCRIEKPHAEFPRNANGSGGVDSRCFECMKVYKAELRQRPHVKLYNAIRHRKNTYGVTHEQYEAMLAAQNGQCAICQEAFRSGKLTHVDHCHTTGKVRGLLCIRCNNNVGVVENEPKMAAIQAYLQTHKG